MRATTLGLTLCARLASLASASEQCAAPPLNLAYRAVAITPGSLTAGIPLQIGSPWQAIALVPSLQIDDTFIPRYTNTCVHDAPGNSTTLADAAGAAAKMNLTTVPVSATSFLARNVVPGLFALADDDESTPSASGNETKVEVEDGWMRCSETYGGAYNPELSSSFAEEKPGDQALRNFTDIWRFADYLDVYGGATGAVPARRNLTSSFQIADDGETFGGYGSALFGLTPNSTVVNALVEAAMVPSTSWSLTNESLCLGCIDTGASSGTWHTFHPSDRYVNPDLACLIKAKVEGLSWHPGSDAEGVSLINDTFTACIDPGIKFLVLPTNATKAFEDMVERSVTAEYDDHIAFEGPPSDTTGVLTFQIEGGLEVNVTVTGAGNASTQTGANWTVPIGQGGWGAYGNQTWVLGKPFTDEIVLRWDGGKKEYGIANRNTNSSATSDLEPLGCDSFPDMEKKAISKPGTGSLVGAIVGGFVGGIVLALAGFLLFTCGKKKKEKNVNSKYAQFDEDTVPMRAMSNQRDSWMTARTPSPPLPSTHEELKSQRLRDHARPGAQDGVGLEVPGSQLYEAPEHGTLYSSKRRRREM